MTTLRKHLPEYLMEAVGLGLFMISAGLFGTLLGEPHSPAHLAIPDPLSRRALAGVAMGLSAVCIIYSPWGRRSGAHINPATTLTFWRLGKVAGRDAVGYAAAQLLGGLAGVLLVGAALGKWFTEPPVSAAATLPGSQGVFVAFVAEAGITFVLMFTVLTLNNLPRLAPYTGLAVGSLVALYITLEEPLSGMSMNPARTLASAVAGGQWTGIWIYFTAPLLGMLAAAEAYVRLRGAAKVRCAKLHHDSAYPCIFCEFQAGKRNLRQVVEMHAEATTMLNTDLPIPAPGS
jgi:aquaporin Z